ncbi:hypothetical protein CWT12_12325 [Actinomyces sp. 432]|uniref:helix-turn-helix domain-containing protein n=1 Tax=Actinomyces sp. 432 TaxID=2057798 RepID=UPI001373C257|nr:hypothetical protein [Actinomyces sp. 432]QHO91938.1 hypothetical protein CWT12_12325 [Actinomyces sp. 432]
MPRLNPDHRTPAHFRTMREALGVSVSDLADALDVNPRSVRDWSTSTTAPAAAWAIIDKRAAWVTATLTATLDELAGQPDPDEVTLSVYATDEQAKRAGLDMTAREHRACVGILALCLMAEGYNVSIDYVPRDIT